jgi:hypothetical protein
MKPAEARGNAVPGIVWEAVKGAVIAADPESAGDEAGLCAAYGGNSYAPDLP